MAIAVSYTIKRQVNEGLEVVYYSGKKEVAILVAYFVAMCFSAFPCPTY